MKRYLKVGIAFFALAALAVMGAHAAWAHGPGAWKQHLEQRLGEALDAAKATPEQRVAVRAAVEHVTATLTEVGQTRGSEMEQALALFEADRLEPAAIAAHRARREGDLKKISDAVTQAIFDVHDALTPPQRQAVADFVRAHHDEERHGGGGFKEEFFKRMISSRIDAGLDAAKLTDAQRATVHSARDRVFAVVAEIHRDRGADLDQALRLFTADQLDGANVEALKAKHQAELARAADAITQAVTEVHGALDAGQRKALVDFVRAHHREHFGEHGGHRG